MVILAIIIIYFKIADVNKFIRTITAVKIKVAFIKISDFARARIETFSTSRLIN